MRNRRQSGAPGVFGEPVAQFEERGSADFVAALLTSENIRAHVEPTGIVAGVPKAYLVCVEDDQVHRARWVLQENEISEAELTYLATGELARGGDGD